MISDKATLVKFSQENKSKLQGFGVKRIGLFGSFLDNSVDTKSDVDFLVEFKKGEKNRKFSFFSLYA